MRRRVAGNAQSLERDSGELECLVSLQQHVGRVRPELDAGRREAVEVLQQEALLLGHVDRRAGRLGEVCHAAEVVPVAVRDEDRGAASAKPAELVDQACGLGARIDDDRFRARTRRPGPRSNSCRSGRAHTC